MDELQELIKEQERDRRNFYVSAFSDKEYLITPRNYRFQDFAGNNPKEKAFCVLRYLGWNHHDIVVALSLSIYQIIAMQDCLSTTYQPENYKRFFEDIPCSIQKKLGRTRIPKEKQKAVAILKGLWWTTNDIISATNVSTRTIRRIKIAQKMEARYCGSSCKSPFNQRVFTSSV